jgi:zinc protease
MVSCIPGAYSAGSAPARGPRPAASWRTPWRALSLAVLLVAVAVPGLAQDPAAPLPLDPSIRTGTLPNGLTYFVRRNTEPQNRALVRLVVKAGSVDEDDDQLGLAHMLEHMAFNGTARFAPGELVSYLESIGARFGPHVNAYTSFDETVYMLDVPTDREGALVRGLEALSDFAGAITLDPDEIDRERGVVIEEWRGRLGAAERMQEPQIRTLFGESRYADRLPIGSPEILKSFPPERLRAFYDEHYRPDRMAVIAVGDFDADAIEARIREEFGRLEARGPAAGRAIHPVPPHADTRYVSLSDREAQGSSVSIVHKHAAEQLRTVGDYRRAIVRSLVHQMINARFAELAREADAPFVAAASGDTSLGRTLEGVSVQARVTDGGLAAGLSALGEEIARVRQHGFGEAELERARRQLLARYERSYNERDQTPSGTLASELVRHVLSGEAAPGIEAELALVRQFLPTITVEEAAGLARELLGDRNRVVLATAPEREGLASVGEADLRAALTAGVARETTAWADEIDGEDLMARLPEPGEVTARREIPEIGVTVLTLSNGMEVWLKPTDFRNDQIVFTAYARGGVSLAPAEAYHDATLATSLVGIAGVGGLSPVDLTKLLAGRIAQVNPFVSTYTHGVNGSSTPRDLEAALQLLHLYFTEPNEDPGAFELMRRRLEAQLANQEANPGSVFGERVRGLNTSDHYTSRPLKVDDLSDLRMERMLSFYRARYANAADFTMFVVGAFSEETIEPLLAQYVASLPSTGVPASRHRDLGLRFPEGVSRDTVRMGQEPRSQTVITFFADTGLDEMPTHRLSAAASVVQNRLRDILREQLGGTYSVGVGYSNTSPQPGYGTVMVQFGSSPENVESLTTAVLEEITRLRREGPTEADVAAVREAEKNELRDLLRQNQYWMNSLQAMHLLERDARRIPERIDRADSLSVDEIHAVLREYVSPERYTIVTLMPER